MDSSTLTSPDKHGSDVSQPLDTSHPKSDSASGVICQHEKRRREHNNMEKKRKEQIKACICKMGELLPPSYITSERHSTLEIVEKSLAYMRELKETRTKFTATEETLQQEIELLKKERDKFSDIIKAAGLSTESVPTNGVSSTTDPRDESPKPKSKTKKRNTLSSQMQQLQDQREKQQQQQEMISSSVTVSEDGSGNMQQNPFMNLTAGGFVNGQNMMFNPMMNQFMMPGIMGNGNQMMPNIGPMGIVNTPSANPNMAGMVSTNNLTGQNNVPGDQTLNPGNKSMEESESGLLQLAMQDAGITPGSSSGPQSSSALTPVSDSGQEAESSSTQNNPLQTLASVATSEQMLESETSGAESQSSVSMTGPLSSNMQQTIMTSAQSGLQSVMQTGNGGLINMPMMGNQSSLPGQQQMQQIMIINEQGIPMIANVPMGIDPNNPNNMFNNSQKGAVSSGITQPNLIKDQSGNIDQNALALAQQQANMAALQNQLLGQGNLGSLQNMPFQQNLLQGNIIQTPSGQLLQQIGPQISGPGQILGMQGQGQGIMVAGQQGQLTLNTMPSQPNQLPSALILPNGQIIPVVTNPGNIISQPGLTLSQGQMTQPRMSASQMQTGMDGQIMTGPNSQGLLIPANSSGHLVVSSATASLSTSVMPTSAIQSVMSTQIQGSSVQTQRPISTSTASSGQTRLISVPQGAISSVGSSSIGAGGKSTGSPILISLPNNGQLTTVLLDPVTLQVLGTLQPGGQQPAVPSQPAGSRPSTSGAGPTSQATPSTGGKNKNKANGNQRAICPKPMGADGYRSQSTTVKKKKAASKPVAKTKETAQADSLSESLQIQIPESTTDPEVSSAVSSDSTDILAKAAESIFSPATGDIGSVGGGFYNPANEDNPLHIDTSVTEAEDGFKSPSKQVKKTSGNTDGKLQDSVLGLHSVAEGGKEVNVTKVVRSSVKLDDAGNDSVTSLSASLEEFTNIQFSETIGNLSNKNSDSIMVSETKVSKKNKQTNLAKATENKKESENKLNKSENKSSKSSKKAQQEKRDLIDLEKMDTDSQLDIESTLIHIPDNIQFNENDLTDVLDQYEQLGNSVPEIPIKTSKKSKSKRGKQAETENEPSAKKRKSAKDEKESGKASTPAKEILSMPASLSVYDFDDSDDIVPPILPLEGKDFTALAATPPRTGFNSFDLGDSLKNDAKSSKNSAQNKTKKSSRSAKSSKESETVSEKESSIDNSCKVSKVEGKGNSEANVKSQLESITDSVKVEKLANEVAVSLPSMPDIDTTTSLFGFQVPKKLQRPDRTASRSQNSQKPASQVSPPKTSPQLQTPQTSPKPNMVSPKSSSNMVSPVPNSFSPEIVSPKLSIVSPSQTVLSDTDIITTSPKQYTEMSPLKKRTPPEKSDSLKVISFSALNSTSLSDTSSKELPASAASAKTDKVPSSSVSSQTTGVITSVKSSSSNNFDPKNGLNDGGGQNVSGVTTSSVGSNSDTASLLPNTSISNNTNSGSNVSTSLSNSRSNSSSGESKFNTPTVTVSNSNTTPRSMNSVNASQNNCYNKYNSNSNIDSAPVMDNRGMVKDNSSRSKLGMNSYPVPYSAESLFSSHSDKVIKSPPNVNISTLNQKPDTSNMSKLRNNNKPYSVDNFVQSSRDEGLRSRPNTLGPHPDLMSSGEIGNPSADFSRLQAESSPDGFNFANIGLNLQPITSNLPNSLMENTTASTSNMSSPFSFSLSSSSSTITTSSGALGHHQFPFFPPPPSLSSSSNIPSSQTSMPSSMPNMYDQSNSSNNVIQRNNTVMHTPGGNNMSRADGNNVPRGGDSMQRNDKGQPMRADDTTQDQVDKPSCSKQKLPKNQGPATIQEPFTNFSNTAAGPDNTFFQDSQMKSSVGKSPTEQMRKQDKMVEMNSSHSRSSSVQSNMSDKRGSAMERSPQMMTSSQPYFPSSYPSSKSLNTPPLHHPSMMPPDDRSRNMTNRSPYDSGFPPHSSQGFNPMGAGYPGSRFDNGPPSFGHDSSGTQPLSHTPVNTGGRKSANPQPPPQQGSVVKPPQKQAAPPLVPMGGPSQQPASQQPRPTQQSHRANTPHGNQPGPAPTPSAGQSRPSKQPSRNSKPPSSSKKSKTLPFMEVDSNLSNNIFENRSMTPFFPMQNLSPQSRMQHEGSPFLSSNFFGPGPRFPNANTPMPKNSDIAAPFNPLFPPRAAQNGLGFNFQPGFGMNPLHGNHGNGSQLTPHTAPHMANFNLNNIFSDGASQNESSLNISPIKFPHTNYQSMDHNAMQHHHQYNRGAPSVMSINSLLGPNHHGFDGRMNTSMAGPFHHSHPSFIPPLNFSMHDH